ncbi:hypothetical protein CDL15_Pgr008012 [Punica granatum]|uniref:Piwi domain-containing protein n=1 Tax=Punica granatum TaxID=22663 RepID=A0A218VRW3_PUNGR|nr:hypothetical protein CDL15_Pgr008012 [Punica granatum]
MVLQSKFCSEKKATYSIGDGSESEPSQWLRDTAPPPPVIPANTERLFIATRNFGTRGQKLNLQTNHFKFSMSKTDGFFYHYSVAMSYLEDGHPIDGKAIRRKVMDKVQETYAPSLEGKDFAYDGENALFRRSSGSPRRGDWKRIKRQYQSKTIVVRLSFAAKIPTQSIVAALHGRQSAHFQEAVRVLVIIPRQNAAKRGCLLVRQSFFHNNPRNFIDIGGGFLGCRGFHSSFRATQGGLSLNIDVSTTMIVQPGPVMEFLISNQNVRDPHKLTGTRFSMKQRNGDGELCTLVSLQRTRALSGQQRASLVEKSRQKPQERKTVLSDALRSSNSNTDPILCSVGNSINSEVQGRLLPPPKLLAGNREEFMPPNGKWSYNKKKLVKPSTIENWAVINFSARCDTRFICETLRKCGNMKGVQVSPSLHVFEENQSLDASHRIREWMRCLSSWSQSYQKLPSLYCAFFLKGRTPTYMEAMREFYKSSQQKKPDHIIIFRDGVSKLQFSKVLNIELEQQIKKAWEFLNEDWHPTFTLIVAQKNHRTKFFQKTSPYNVRPATIVDSGVCQPKFSDFYLCAHAGMIGKTQPTHYHVFYDDLDHSDDDLRELVHSLSYVYQRSTTAISVVAPISYAHLAAAQVGQFVKFKEMSNSASSHGGVTSSGGITAPELPQLHKNVRDSMFFF